MSRFSRIGGEMLPLGVVEDELHSRLGQTGVVTVTAVPDEKKGGKLMLLYASEADDAETRRRYLSESTRAYFWKPGRDCYIEVESLSILGTGKLDLKGIREIALAAVAD